MQFVGPMLPSSGTIPRFARDNPKLGRAERSVVYIWVRTCGLVGSTSKRMIGVGEHVQHGQFQIGVAVKVAGFNLAGFDIGDVHAVV